MTADYERAYAWELSGLIEFQPEEAQTPVGALPVAAAPSGRLRRAVFSARHTAARTSACAART